MKRVWCLVLVAVLAVGVLCGFSGNTDEEIEAALERLDPLDMLEKNALWMTMEEAMAIPELTTNSGVTAAATGNVDYYDHEGQFGTMDVLGNGTVNLITYSFTPNDFNDFKESYEKIKDDMTVAFGEDYSVRTKNINQTDEEIEEGGLDWDEMERAYNTASEERWYIFENWHDTIRVNNSGIFASVCIAKNVHLDDEAPPGISVYFYTREVESQISRVLILWENENLYESFFTGGEEQEAIKRLDPARILNSDVFGMTMAEVNEEKEWKTIYGQAVPFWGYLDYYSNKGYFHPVDIIGDDKIDMVIYESVPIGFDDLKDSYEKIKADIITVFGEDYTSYAESLSITDEEIDEEGIDWGEIERIYSAGGKSFFLFEYWDRPYGMMLDGVYVGISLSENISLDLDKESSMQITVYFFTEQMRVSIEIADVMLPSGMDES